MTLVVLHCRCTSINWFGDGRIPIDWSTNLGITGWVRTMCVFKQFRIFYIMIYIDGSGIERLRPKLKEKQNELEPK